MNDIVYNIIDSKISIKNDNETVDVKFSYPVEEVILFDSILVVRLNITPKVIFNENVYGVDFQGNVKWQVPKIKHLYDDSPYTGMSKKENNVYLYNWDGTDLLLNPNTGIIVEKGWSK